MPERPRTPLTGRDDPRHGTPAGYTNGGCRCDPCTWAWSSHRRGDRPADPAPVWFDAWLESAGAL